MSIMLGFFAKMYISERFGFILSDYIGKTYSFLLFRRGRRIGFST